MTTPDDLTDRFFAAMDAGYAPLPLANPLGQWEQTALARIWRPTGFVDVAQFRAGWPGIVTRFRIPQLADARQPWPVIRSGIQPDPAEALDELLRWPHPDADIQTLSWFDPEHGDQQQ